MAKRDDRYEIDIDSIFWWLLVLGLMLGPLIFQGLKELIQTAKQ